MATGVWSWSTTAASNDSADSTINWTEGQAPSTVNNSARAEMAAQAKYLLDAHGALTATGAADTYSVTTNSTIAALRDGLGLSLVINDTSTGASTLNVDGLGAKAIRKITGAGEVAIGAGDVVADGHYIFHYDASADSGSGAWILLNPAPAAAVSYLANIVEDTTPQLGGMLDVNGQAIGDGTLELLKFSETGSAVNEITIANAATGNGPAISATGDDTNIDILLAPKGSGVTKSGGVEVATLTGTQTLTNKTLTSPAINTPTLSAPVVTTPTSVNWTGTESLDPANGDIQDITLTGNVTTLTDSMADGESVVLQIDDGTAYAITWPTITWVSGGGTAPTLQTTGDTIISIWKNATTLFGFASNGA